MEVRIRWCCPWCRQSRTSGNTSVVLGALSKQFGPKQWVRGSILQRFWKCGICYILYKLSNDDWVYAHRPLHDVPEYMMETLMRRTLNALKTTKVRIRVWWLLVSSSRCAMAKVTLFSLKMYCNSYLPLKRALHTHTLFLYIEILQKQFSFRQPLFLSEMHCRNSSRKCNYCLIRRGVKGKEPKKAQKTQKQ